MEIEKLKPIIESLLFINGEPLPIAKLAKIVGIHKAQVDNALMVLSGEYESQNRGIRIIKKGEEVQLATSPDNAVFIEQLLRGELQESLTPAALEVLSIVAYRGPLARADVEAIRGVNSSFTLRGLLLRGLIGRKENPRDARGYIYEISFEFLKHLGIDDIKKLPEYEKLAQDNKLENIIK
jgi:segregation and condensation protein B